jgi:regulator of protease activity HflC (stomatin/prohibitin superfamily)
MYRKTIKEYELGVEWHEGKITGLLKPGRYPLGRRLKRRADIFDTRQVVIRVPGQEIMLADKTSVKVNITGAYQIADPVKLVQQINFTTLDEHITHLVQLAVRDVLVSKKIEDVFEDREAISDSLQKKMKSQFNELGLNLLGAKIKDVILPADLRKAYTEALAAQLKAKAQLEQARGQSAALRNLANTADLIEKHPQLVQLMSLQSGDAAVNLHFESVKKDSK